VDTSCVDNVDDTNSVEEVSTASADDEVGHSISSVVVAPTSSANDDPLILPVHCFCW